MTITVYLLSVMIIVCILLAYVLYNIYNEPIREGLETRIKREDGKLVKRRKKKVTIIEGAGDPLGDAIKESIRNTKKTFEQAGEGLKKSTQIFDEVSKGFKRIGNFFKVIGDIFNYIPKLFNYLSSYLRKVFDNITKAFKYIPAVFIWLGSYLTGGLRFIINFPKCFGWYSLDVLGKTLYSPLKFLFWLFNLQYIENMLWGYAENIDCICKKYTGYHLIHFSDNIIDQCYVFCPDEFPKFPDLDWAFNPPTLNIGSF